MTRNAELIHADHYEALVRHNENGTLACMPKMYRSMTEASGKPEIGSESSRLGIRYPHAEAQSTTYDVEPDENGNVHPGGGGMSTSPCVGCIQFHLIPTRLRLQGGAYRSARGKDRNCIWTMGSGVFEDNNSVDANLQLRVTEHYNRDIAKNTLHGLVEPNQIMPLAHYQSGLAETQNRWTKDETPHDKCKFCS